MLKEYLDDFALVYINNMLIYSSSSRVDYICKVRLVLKKLSKAGLYLDPDKYKFIIKGVKYLAFIRYIGVSIEIDFKKVYTIKE